MNDQIRVHVVDYGRGSLYMRYRDPLTGKQVARSTGTKKQKQAEKAAAVWEDELRNGRYKSPSRVTWDEFRKRFEKEYSMSDSYAYAMQATMNGVEELSPGRLANVNADFLSRFRSHLETGRKRKLSPHTIKTYFKHLHAALSWAVDVGLLHELPKFPRVSTPKGRQAKGRAITLEEFERMIENVAVVRPDDAEPWERLLWGLWHSGLRVSEALLLSWDLTEPFALDLENGCIRIDASAQKSRRHETLPLTPDFEDWLSEIPVEDRSGFVFPMPVRKDAVQRIIGKIADKANVKATAHDLRRSFGTRWARRVMPATLQRLMRHGDIKTTMAFYVDLDAGSVRNELRRLGNTLGNTPVGTTGFEPATS